MAEIPQEWVEKAAHRPVDRRELGYVRRVCATCGSDWPCSIEGGRRDEVAEKSVRDPDPRVLAAVASVLASWGVRSRHGEWTDEETQRNAARAVLAVVADDMWPCDNYQGPLTCLTAPCAKGSECDFCRAQAEAVRRAPAVDREALAEWWQTFDGPAYPTGAEVADALLASGVVQDAAAVRRAVAEQALSEAADDYERMYQQPGSATGADWLRRRARSLASPTDRDG